MAMIGPYADMEARSFLRSSRTSPDVRRNSQPFESLLYNWHIHIRREQELRRKLYESSVTIRRRGRGITISDQCGHFGVQQDTQGRWLDYDPDLDGDIYPINIVGPTLAANQNTCLQSNAKVEVAAANASAQIKRYAENWQRVSDYFERTSWQKDEAMRALLFDGVQCDGTWFVEVAAVRCGERDDAQIRSEQLGVAAYQCEACEARGMYEVEQQEEGEAMLPCPSCEAPAPHLIRSLSRFNLDEIKVPKFKIIHRLRPFYNVTIDAYNAKVEGINGAKWLQIETLEDKVQLETDYPHCNFGGPMRWSYPLRCDYSLANGSWDYLNYAYARGEFMEFQRFGKQAIYLHQDAYSNYFFPADYEWINGKGEMVLKAKEGDTVAQAYERAGIENPEGLKYIYVDDRLIDIVRPSIEEQVNFRKFLSDVHWRRDSGSYLTAPFHSIVTIQDGLTLQNTLNINITARNAHIPVYYDSKVFSQDDFLSEYIGTDNAHLMPNRDITKAAFQLPIPTPSPYLQKNIEFYLTLKDTITNVTPALRGEAQRGETLGAVRQQLEQSYGGLTSTLKSFAQCKVNVFRQKAELAKQCWGVEDFQSVASMFGEKWNETDIEGMRAMEFDRDLIVSYRDGSETPQSNLDREMKFAAGINSLMPFIEAGVPIPPDKFARILEKIDTFAGFEFDLTGLEVTDLLVQKRYLDLQAACEPYEQVTLYELDAMRSTVVAIEQDGTPVTKLDLLTEEIFHKAEIRFSQYEQLQMQAAFFVEQFQLEQAAVQTNHVLAEMLQALLGMLEMAQNALQAEAMANDPENIARQEERAAAEADAERQKADKEEERAANAESEDRKLKGEIMKQAVDHENKMDQLALQAAASKQAAAAKPAPKAKSSAKKK